jgi:hypothetical protein
MMKTFINTSLGETWMESGEAPDWQRLQGQKEEWTASAVQFGSAGRLRGWWSVSSRYFWIVAFYQRLAGHSAETMSVRVRRSVSLIGLSLFDFERYMGAKFQEGAR